MSNAAAAPRAHTYGVSRASKADGCAGSHAQIRGRARDLGLLKETR